MPANTKPYSAQTHLCPTVSRAYAQSKSALEEGWGTWPNRFVDACFLWRPLFKWVQPSICPCNVQVCLLTDYYSTSTRAVSCAFKTEKLFTLLVIPSTLRAAVGYLHLFWRSCQPCWTWRWNAWHQTQAETATVWCTESWNRSARPCSEKSELQECGLQSGVKRTEFSHCRQEQWQVNNHHCYNNHNQSINNQSTTY